MQTTISWIKFNSHVKILSKTITQIRRLHRKWSISKNLNDWIVYMKDCVKKKLFKKSNASNFETSLRSSRNFSRTFENWSNESKTKATRQEWCSRCSLSRIKNKLSTRLRSKWRCYENSFFQFFFSQICEIWKTRYIRQSKNVRW